MFSAFIIRNTLQKFLRTDVSLFSGEPHIPKARLELRKRGKTREAEGKQDGWRTRRRNGSIPWRSTQRSFVSENLREERLLTQGDTSSARPHQSLDSLKAVTTDAVLSQSWQQNMELRQRYKHRSCWSRPKRFLCKIFHYESKQIYSVLENSEYWLTCNPATVIIK